jgi:hypothetical protein
MKVYVIVEGVPGRFVSVKKTKLECEELIIELKSDNRKILDNVLEYRILEQEI